MLKRLLARLTQRPALSEEEVRAAEPVTKTAESGEAVTGLLESGRTLHRQGNLPEAKRIYDAVLGLQPENFDALHLSGVIALQNGEFPSALALFSRAIKTCDTQADVFFNQGNALREVKQFEAAHASYSRAIELNPDDAQAFANRGLTLQALKRIDDAQADLVRAVTLDPNYANGFYFLALVLEDLGHLEEALQNYQRALQLKPDFDFLEGLQLHLKMRMCDWQGFDEACHRIELAIERGARAIAPLAWLALSSSLTSQRACAEIWRAARVAKSSQPLSRSTQRRDGRIRIGYFSADFHDHATAYLMAELFERHDRERFEFYAFSFGLETSGTMRLRLERAFENFLDVRFRSDHEIAEESRNLGIDIAVDLKGYTIESRPGIFAARAAPIQIAYIGFPGTTSADFTDYLIADPVLITPSTRIGYSEKIITLPGCYQVNDSTRPTAATTLSRADVGLPSDAFVFCSFNNNYKILPATFALWMRILREIGNSVLWMFEDNAVAAANLRTCAASHGVDPVRIISATRVPLADHLARQSMGDLFLDTFPCCAHTTASDALWAGLPIVTRSGETFASRVAASLLHAVGLEELIANDADGYYDIALNLARNRTRLDAIRTRLIRARSQSPLFNAERFARNIEAGFLSSFERYQAGLPCADIDLSRSGADQALLRQV